MAYVKPTTPKKAGTKLGRDISKMKPSKPLTGRTTKRPDVKPVTLPSKPGNIATGSKRTARPTPTGKITKKPITPRKRLDVSKMTPAQKAAYYAQQGYDNY